MRRALLFTTDLEIGGTPTVVRELARRLPACGCATEVACLGRLGPTARQIVGDGGTVHAFDVGLLQLPSAVRRLRRLVKSGGFDAVLSLLVHANAVAALARRRGDRVRWWESIQTTQPTPRWHWRVQRWAARRADGFVVPSESIRAVAEARSGIDPRRVHVLPNGVDAADVAEHARPPRDPSSVLRVGFLGRLDPVKRVPMLVEAMRHVDRAELHVFGDGPERAAVERAKRGTTNVTLHGFADRLAALEQIDVLCLPSIAEGFPMVLVEAMAAGVPTIGTDAPGIRDAIVDGETGLLFASDGLAPLVSALRQVRDDPAAAATPRRRGVGSRARRPDVAGDRPALRHAAAPGLNCRSRGGSSTGRASAFQAEC